MNVVTNKKAAAEQLGGVSVDKLNTWLEAGCPGEPGNYDIDAMQAWVDAQTADSADDDEAAEEPRGRQTNAPICPIHHDACESRHSSPYFTFYYCREPGCSFSQKVPRPNLQQHLRRQRRSEADHSAR